MPLPWLIGAAVVAAAAAVVKSVSDDSSSSDSGEEERAAQIKEAQRERERAALRQRLASLETERRDNALKHLELAANSLGKPLAEKLALDASAVAASLNANQATTSRLAQTIAAACSLPERSRASAQDIEIKHFLRNLEVFDRLYAQSLDAGVGDPFSVVLGIRNSLEGRNAAPARNPRLPHVLLSCAERADLAQIRHASARLDRLHALKRKLEQQG